LHLAARSGRSVCVDLLVQLKADIEVRNHYNASPLITAASKGRAKVHHVLPCVFSLVDRSEGFSFLLLVRWSRYC